MRLTLFRAVCALAAIASLVAVTGCGGDSKTDSYKKDATTVTRNFESSAQAASQQVQSATTQQARIKGLEALKKSVDDAANGFAKLTPPDNAKADHEKLVTGFRSLSTDIDSVTQAVKTNDRSAAAAALPKLQADQAKVQEAIQSLRSKTGG